MQLWGRREGGRRWLWAPWVPRAPHGQGDTGDNLSVSPCPSASFACPGCLGLLGSLPVAASGCAGEVFIAQGPKVRPHKYCPAMGGTAGALGTGLCPVGSAGLFSSAACRSIPSSALGLGSGSAPIGGNRSQVIPASLQANPFLPPCRPIPSLSVPPSSLPCCGCHVPGSPASSGV